MDEIEVVKETSKLKNPWIKFGLFFVLTFLVLHLYSDLGYLFEELSTELIILIEIGLSIVMLFIFFLCGKYIPKKEKPEKIDFENIESNDIRKKREDNKEYNNQAWKEIQKRKDYTTKELIGGQFENIISQGVFVLVIGLFLLGAIPAYFNVNDEFINPTNESFNINNTLNRAGYITMSVFHDTGSSSPALWFWMFWACVFMAFILPAIKIIYFLIKKKIKGG